jgi:hypothetical protein
MHSSKDVKFGGFVSRFREFKHFSCRQSWFKLKWTSGNIRSKVFQAVIIKTILAQIFQGISKGLKIILFTFSCIKFWSGTLSKKSPFVNAFCWLKLIKRRMNVRPCQIVWPCVTNKILHTRYGSFWNLNLCRVRSLIQNFKRIRT